MAQHRILHDNLALVQKKHPLIRISIRISE
jgi:hypothetical protein